MDIIGFALQSCNKNGRGGLPREETAIVSYSILNRIPYKFYNRYQDVPEGFIPCGSVKWCENFLSKEKTVPNYYPDFLNDYLFRKVWRADKWIMDKGIFIKPADKHKRFTGFITLGGYKKKKKGPYWCSEVVHFINEWRYYIADGKILTGEWYSGDEINTPDAPELKINIPENFCGAIDFGMLDTGELALIENNGPYACGWYGKNDKLYAEWLIKGWKSLQ